jgi:hypothetical protein
MFSLGQTKPTAKDPPSSPTALQTVDFEFHISPAIKELMTADAEDVIAQHVQANIEKAGLKIADATHRADGGAHLIILVSGVRDKRSPLTFVIMTLNLREDVVFARTGKKGQAATAYGSQWGILGTRRQESVETLVMHELDPVLKSWQEENPTLAKTPIR